ncbi:hypothetical protein FE236_00960 [Mariprofundus erugo]|uniref:hypothetical protein n=1 Tax=Mariprofundus erugo TaxID=2528639 RepID=UPI0010FD0CB5|nr:hypothetical protein [Mariprofundus erugo]TLS78353.1 hypothetical protein FE236_00960 [Mariprofundus erugo]
MSVCVQSIDQIGREKSRDVLMVTFTPPGTSNHAYTHDRFDWEQCNTRNEFIAWLESHQVDYRWCYGFWSDGLLSAPYQGHIFIDVPHDKKNEQYKLLDAWFPDDEHYPSNARMWYFPLEICMRNAHHDEPGYWDDW